MFVYYLPWCIVRFCGGASVAMWSWITRSGLDRVSIDTDVTDFSPASINLHSEAEKNEPLFFYK